MSSAPATHPSRTGSSAKPLIKRPSGTRYRTVLSIDGGGVRGIIPVTVLQRLEVEIKEHIFENRQSLIPEDIRASIGSTEDFDIDLTDYFELVAGTSIGSWIACYIACRGRGSEGILNDPEIQRKYGNVRVGSVEAGRIASLEFATRVFPRMNSLRRLTRVFRPAYPSDGLEESLNLFFGDTTMNDMETGCLITSYDLQRNAACSFLRGSGSNGRNYTVRTAVRQGPRTSATVGALETDHPEDRAPHPGYEQWEPDLEIIEDTNYRLRDIALASSSAPTYFRPARISPVDVANAEELLLVDGGVVANNPTLQAMTYAPNTFSSGDIRDVAVFSVGCGTADPTAEQDPNPGLGWWMTSGYLMDAIRNGTGEYIQAVVDYWIYRNLGLPFGQYVRIQRSEPSNTESGRILNNMDNPDNIPALEELGRELAKNNASHIKRFVKDYIFAT